MSEENKSSEEQSYDGRASSAIFSGVKYAIYVLIVYYIAKWLGWVD